MKQKRLCREKITFLLPAIFLTILIIVFRKRFTHIFVPIILALLISYMMEPVVLLFEKKANMKRIYALLLTFVLCFVILT